MAVAGGFFKAKKAWKDPSSFPSSLRKCLKAAPPGRKVTLRPPMLRPPSKLIAPPPWARGRRAALPAACNARGLLGFAIMLWLRVMELAVAATLSCAVAHTAYAEPKPADSCKRAAFRVVIDVGHTEKAPGAISARGVPEFVFNSNLAKRIEERLLAAGFRRSVLLITEGPAGKGLLERVRSAKALAADLFL